MKSGYRIQNLPSDSQLGSTVSPLGIAGQLMFRPGADDTFILLFCSVKTGDVLPTMQEAIAALFSLSSSPCNLRWFH